MIHFDSCPVCNSANISIRNEIKDYAVSGKSFPICQCADCTFLFTQDIPSKSDISLYYQSDSYISHSDSKKGIVNKLYHIVRNYTIRQKVSLIKGKSSSKNGKLLDVGCGTGSFLDAMKKEGWDAIGMEPDEKARNFAKSKGLQIYDADYMEQLDVNAFDIVTLWHVLEHIHDLQSNLERFRNAITNDGKLIVAVPNHLSFDAKYYGKYWAAYDVPRHLYHFSPKSLEILMARFSFELVEVRPMWFDSFYVSMLSEKYKNGSFVKAFFIGMLSNLFSLWKKNRCSSLIYIFKPVSKV